MKRILLFIFIFSISLGKAQVRFYFGPSPMSTAEVNEDDMNKLLKKSYRFTFYVTGDSIPDSVLIHEVILLSEDYDTYCIRYKDDTNKAAVSIDKLKGDKGFKITAYFKNRNIKRISLYTSKAVPTGKWMAFYQDRWLKQMGHYVNGKKDGKWKYYDDSGNKTTVEYYKNGALLKSVNP